MNGNEFAAVISRAQAEQRRPGITAVEDEIRKAHPRWSERRVQTEAKAIWQARQVPK